MYEDMLIALNGVSNIVQSCASGRVHIFQTEWHAIIIKPYGRLLDYSNSPKLYAQATYDVAVALQLCADRCIAHRDVTSNNIIVYNGRGVLCDFSVAKVSKEWAALVQQHVLLISAMRSKLSPNVMLRLLVCGFS